VSASSTRLRIWGSGVRIPPSAPVLRGSVPDTWVTVYSGDMGNTFAPKGFSRGSSLEVCVQPGHKSGGLANGTPLSVRMALGYPNGLKTASIRGTRRLLWWWRAPRTRRPSDWQVGDGERITVATVGEHEFALIVGAPQLIGLSGKRECRSVCSVSRVLTRSTHPCRSVPLIALSRATWRARISAWSEAREQRDQQDRRWPPRPQQLYA
jgi:hypothetical protein